MAVPRTYTLLSSLSRGGATRPLTAHPLLNPYNTPHNSTKRVALWWILLPESNLRRRAASPPKKYDQHPEGFPDTRLLEGVLNLGPKCHPYYSTPHGAVVLSGCTGTSSAAPASA